MSVRLKMAIIQQHGCWKSLLQQKKWNWGSILQRCTKVQSYTGIFSCVKSRQTIELRHNSLKELTMQKVQDFFYNSIEWLLIFRLWPFCFRRNKGLVKELSTPAPGSKDLYFPSQYSTSLLTQCMACLWKQHWSYWRNPLYTAIRFLYSTSVAVVIGSMFWNLGSKM